MRDLHRNTGLFANAQGLSNRRLQSSALATHMGGVDAATVTHYLGECHQLRGITIAPRRIDEARRDAKRTILHGLSYQTLHLQQLSGTGQTVLEAHDRNTHRAMPHQRRNIHGTAALADALIKLPQALPVPGQAWIQKSRVLFQQLERLWTHWRWRKTAIPYHLSGDALAHLAVCPWRAQQGKVRMRVHVDKP